MRLRFGPCVLIVTLGALASWACSLNPQPLPPDTFDASMDGALTLNSPDAAGGIDSGAANDSSPPPNDAEVVDAPDDATDASDAETESDATMDARDDG